MEIWKLVINLFVIILLIVLGTKYINKNEFAIITGIVDLEANTSEKAVNGELTYTETTVNYPSGFTKENCIIIATARHNTNNEQLPWSYGWKNIPDSQDIFRSTLPITVSLYGQTDNSYSNKIKISMGNLSTNKNKVEYKIILFKM